jgi:hypothetical protein
MEEIKRSRLKTVWFFGIIMSFLCCFSIYKEMEGVATVFAAGIGAIVAKYSHDETARKSIKND